MSAPADEARPRDESNPVVQEQPDPPARVVGGSTIGDASAPQVGDAAPDVRLLESGLSEVTLSAYWQNRPALTVFLRYFGCPFCQMQVVKLRDERERLEGAGASIVLIGQGDAREEEAFREARQVPFPILIDTDRRAYRAYGLGRGSPMQLYGPRVGVPFLRANLSPETRQRGLRGGSFLQMPGTFVVDTSGVIRMAHRNRTVSDNPRNDKILRVLEAITPEPPA
jgi:peroxiredoxin